MRIISDKQELQELLAEWRLRGERIALVPTMGNLHEGHASLVEIAEEYAERIVVSVFVNPTQFGADEDFEEYPRTLDHDTRRLEGIRTDVLYAPQVTDMYPFGVEQATVVSVPYRVDEFCGSSRPGHFDGVTSVVARLFLVVQPDIAVFGLKDYQQQLLIRRMVTDLGLPVDIISAPTIRHDDGLAMSSRNNYLTRQERGIAPALYATLSQVAYELQDGQGDFAGLEEKAASELAKLGFDVEYVAVRRAHDLGAPSQDCTEVVVLAAVRLGKTRLIDNIIVTI